MTNRYEQAELLAALWKLGAKDKRIPTSHGILDRALQDCVSILPKPLKDGLSFGVTGVGLRCYELPNILLAAQEAMLTSEPNPTYQSSIVTIDESRAREIVVSLGLSTTEAKRIGEALQSAVESVRAKISGKQDQLLPA
jgi:hypothetical protein